MARCGVRASPFLKYINVYLYYIGVHVHDALLESKFEYLSFYILYEHSFLLDERDEVCVVGEYIERAV